MTLLDAIGNELPLILSNITMEKIKIRIPRDPSLILPPMSYENVTSLNNTAHRLIFNLHFINISSHLPISVHLEMRPINASRSYLFIHRFDQSPQLNTSIQIIDGWTLFCSASETSKIQFSTSSLSLCTDVSDDGQHRYFLDNQQTVNHQGWIFGLRELNETENEQHCLNRSVLNTSLPISDDGFHFTTDYQLRLYTSGCYFIDDNGHWKADGLVVSYWSARWGLYRDRLCGCRLDQQRITTRHNVCRHI